MGSRPRLIGITVTAATLLIGGVFLGLHRQTSPRWERTAYEQRLSSDAWQASLSERPLDIQRRIASDPDYRQIEYQIFLLTACARILRDAEFKEGEFLSLPTAVQTSLRDAVATSALFLGTWPAQEQSLVVRFERSYMGTFQISFVKQGELIAVIHSPVM